MNQFYKVAFYTLGCKLNFSETSTISRTFQNGGFGVVGFEELPDVYVINSCSVTENADRKCRQIISKAKNMNPSSLVVMIGCYAQLKPDYISSIPGVDLVLGANEKFDILSYVNARLKQNVPEDSKVYAGEIKTLKEFVPSFSIDDRTRSFLKIQDGCDYFCSFCTIPLARGRSRNGSISNTVSLANELAEKGVNEIVLTGVNIGDFGQGSDENFLNLITELDNINGIKRIRISSIEPNLLSNEIIEFVANSKLFVPHFHIPLQSGSDLLLKKMRRRYDVELYLNRVRKIKELLPHACIGADVIVGFPGESETEFNKTYQFLQDLDVSYLHVFTYSERNNTTAIRMEEAVPLEIRKTRSKMLRILSDKKKRRFYEDQLSSIQNVLIESEFEAGYAMGFTENYIKITAKSTDITRNSIVKVKLESILPNGLVSAVILN